MLKGTPTVATSKRTKRRRRIRDHVAGLTKKSQALIAELIDAAEGVITEGEYGTSQRGMDKAVASLEHARQDLAKRLGQLERQNKILRQKLAAASFGNYPP